MSFPRPEKIIRRPSGNSSRLGVFGCAGSFHTEKDSPMNFPRPGKIIRPLAGRSRGIVGGLDAEKAYMMNFRKAQTASTFVLQRRKKLANEFSQAEKNHLATVWQELWVLGTWLSKKCPRLVPPTTRIVELRTDYAATTRRLRGEYAKSRIACTHTCAYTYIHTHIFHI